MAETAAPNGVLRALLAEAAWTEEELARRVNAVAGEAGMVLRLDRRSVAHWLSGRRPRPPVPALVAEVLSRELGRPLTPAVVGMSARKRPSTAPEPERVAAFGTGEVVEMLQRLGPDDERRRVLGFGAYSVAALAVPDWAEAVAPLRSRDKDGPNHETSEAERLDPARVATAELMTRVFSDADDAFGGGHSRSALASYLSSEIAPLLRAAGPARLKTRLRSAASQLAYLAAFMCFDDQQHTQAQGYYRVVLGLAGEGGDATAYAVTLRAMSVQARLLGHTRHAVQLAETAATTGRTVPPIRQAFLLGQLAVAAASDRDQASALSALRAAEHHFERATSRTPCSAADPMGGFHPAALAHQQAAVRALLGDRTGAINALTHSLRQRPASERRSRAITTARLAELHLAGGHLEQAITVWDAFLHDYPHLQSARASTALTHMRQRLRPHTRHPAAQRLLARAAAL